MSTDAPPVLRGLPEFPTGAFSTAAGDIRHSQHRRANSKVDIWHIRTSCALRAS